MYYPPTSPQRSVLKMELEAPLLEEATKKPPKKKQKVRGLAKTNWFFTDNGEAGANGEKLKAQPWLELPKGVTYLFWQVERGGLTEHRHLQGHLELTRTQHLSWLHKHISPTASFQTRLGTAAQCDIYCSKQETRESGPYTLGQKSKGQGQRTDLEQLVMRCKEGASWRMLVEEKPSDVHKYARFIERLKTIYMPKYDPDGKGSRVLLLFGKAGCGKTKAAFAKWELDDFYELPLAGSSSTWWDGLDGHNKILMDDFCGAASHMRLDVLLKILDRYPRRVPVKGSFEVLVGDKKIILTSNIHPRLWYKWKDREEQYQALKRRFESVFIWVNEECQLAADDFWEDYDEVVIQPLSTMGHCNHRNNFCVYNTNCK